MKVRFGGVIALGGVSFDVGYSQICGLIGPNGSGKTTLFNCISGIYRYQDGDIPFEGNVAEGARRATAWPASASAAPSRTSRCSAA